jgi:hypothetical protein
VQRWYSRFGRWKRYTEKELKNMGEGGAT